MQNIFDALRQVAFSGYPLGKFKEIGYVPRVENPVVRNDLTTIIFELLNQSRLRRRFVQLNSANGGLGIADFRDFDGSADWLFHASDPQHVFSFEHGRYEDSQWNVGITAGVTAADDYLRIGLGFISNGPNSAGRQSYDQFAHRVKNNTAAFDNLMNQMTRGGYAIFDGVTQEPVQAAWLLDRQQRRMITGAGWRFVGEKLQRQQVNGWSPSQFASHCLDVFETFLQAGFPARY